MLGVNACILNLLWQILYVNEPPRLSDALLSNGGNLYAIENLLHPPHPEPSRLLSVTYCVVLTVVGAVSNSLSCVVCVCRMKWL